MFQIKFLYNLLLGCWEIWLIVLVTIIVFTALVVLVIGILIAVKKNKTKKSTGENINYNLPAGVPIQDIHPNEARAPPKNPY